MDYFLKFEGGRVKLTSPPKKNYFQKTILIKVTMFLTVCAPPSNYCETTNFNIKEESANNINLILITYYSIKYQHNSFLEKNGPLQCF